MHLVPADQHVLEGERVCNAIAAIGPPGNIAGWAGRFALLGDPTRLALLIAIDRAGPISVTDLAAATGTSDTTVSQALRILRAAGVVTALRDGRVIRYELADGEVHDLLVAVRTPQPTHAH